MNPEETQKIIGNRADFLRPLRHCQERHRQVASQVSRRRVVAPLDTAFGCGSQYGETGRPLPEHRLPGIRSKHADVSDNRILLPPLRLPDFLP